MCLSNRCYIWTPVIYTAEQRNLFKITLAVFAVKLYFMRFSQKKKKKKKKKKIATFFKISTKFLEK